MAQTSDEDHMPATEETWKRAREFVERNAKSLSDRFGLAIDAPEILLGPDGSIDLHWDYLAYEMLINILADPTAKAGFYGDNHGEIQFKGSFDPSSHNAGLILFLWLAMKTPNMREPGAVHKLV